MAMVIGSYRHGNNTHQRMCCACRVIKSLTYFVRSKYGTLGRKYLCRDCENLKSKIRYQANRSKVLERIKLYASTHKKQRAEIVARWRLKHPKRWVEVRKIINLNAKVKRLGLVGRISSVDWESLKKKYSYTCPCCLREEPEIKLTIDHIVPVVERGNNEISNIQPLCKSCNCKKYNKTIKYEKPITKIA